MGSRTPINEKAKELRDKHGVELACHTAAQTALQHERNSPSGIYWGRVWEKLDGMRGSKPKSAKTKRLERRAKNRRNYTP